MNNFQNRPALERNCLNCVHHTYEENQEEVAEAKLPCVLVCFQRRKVIEKQEQAVDCISYYTPNMDIG